MLALAGKAWGFLTSIELNQLWSDGWFPRSGRFQLPALVVHTLVITGIAMLVAVPFGLGSAVYLSEYARSSVRRVLKPTLEILAGIPSVVLGFFALQFISPNVVRGLFPDAQSANFLAAGIAVGILTIPLVASVSEDAMRAVPTLVAGGLLRAGAKEWHTALRVVFPAAISGIIAAIILGISRAVGETMVVALAAGPERDPHLQPARRWSHHDRGHGQPGRGLRPGRRRCGRLPVVVLRRSRAVCVDVGPERDQWAHWSVATGRGTEMVADARALTTTELVRRSIEGRRFSPINALVAASLLFTLLSSVVILDHPPCRHHLPLPFRSFKPEDSRS